MAKSESDVFTDAADQGTAACGFSLAYAATRKIAARISWPRISSMRPRLPRASLAGIGGLIWLLAQERVEKLLQNRPGNNSRRRGIALALVMNDKCGCSLHRYRGSQHDVLDDVRIDGAASFGLRQ